MIPYLMRRLRRNKFKKIRIMRRLGRNKLKELRRIMRRLGRNKFIKNMKKSKKKTKYLNHLITS